MSRSPAACKAAPPSPPPPALAAASQAIAARRHSLPPSPGNLGSPSLQRPAISLTAASGRAAHQQAGSPAPAARPGTSASASPASGSPALPAAPPGMPNTAAALLDKVAQPPATQPPPPPWGSVPAAPGARSPPTKHGVPAAAAAPESTWGARGEASLCSRVLSAATRTAPQLRLAGDRLLPAALPPFASHRLSAACCRSRRSLPQPGPREQLGVRRRLLPGWRGGGQRGGGDGHQQVWWRAQLAVWGLG